MGERGRCSLQVMECSEAGVVHMTTLIELLITVCMAGPHSQPLVGCTQLDACASGSGHCLVGCVSLSELYVHCITLRWRSGFSNMPQITYPKVQTLSCMSSIPLTGSPQTQHPLPAVQKQYQVPVLCAGPACDLFATDTHSLIHAFCFVFGAVLYP